MLKFIKDGNKLRFVLRDEDDMPQDIKKISKETLRDMGIIIEDDEQEKKKKLSGLSQDDLEFIQKKE